MIGTVVKNPIFRVTSNRYFVRFVLFVGVVLGIATWACVAVVDISALSLEKACVSFALVATILFTIHTAFHVGEERAALGKSSPPSLLELWTIGGSTL